ncbi:hypothetical protein EJ04DRAFT_263475 [Polyplosphaeria fusca]|uniref:Uncharacterized protein n=1 Tax=Polyplosphaeria fusca TaxID=682080 RepID=A0A9P4V8Z6_9PLEO|nr:hypothetical protein EJ04DRAFT_263475 [Polyplosphaeria fusca]
MEAHSSPPLLRIPVELRYQIYSLLCKPDVLCYPYPNSPITTISLHAPPRALLLANRQISQEVCAHFYGLATFRLTALDAAPIKREELSVGCLKALGQAKRVELQMCWNLNGNRRLGKRGWPWSMDGWVAEMVELLRDVGKQLLVVVVCVRVGTRTRLPEDWDIERTILEPLMGLKGRVRFEVSSGVIVHREFSDDVMRDLGGFVKELNS